METTCKKKFLEKTKEEKLIDFGFGKGTALDFFEQRVSNVTGVEISSYAISKQKKRKKSLSCKFR